MRPYRVVTKGRTKLNMNHPLSVNGVTEQVVLSDTPDGKCDCVVNCSLTICFKIKHASTLWPSLETHCIRISVCTEGHVYKDVYRRPVCSDQALGMKGVPAERQELNASHSTHSTVYSHYTARSNLSIYLRYILELGYIGKVLEGTGGKQTRK